MTTGTAEALAPARPDTRASLRIAVVNWGRRHLGGAESYIAGILPELHRLGHELAFWSELDDPRDRDPIPLPPGTAEWCAGELGLDRALQELRDWRPDLLFVHVVTRPEVEAALLEIAPAVLYTHGYLGACISGERMLKNPVPTPCGRQFGLGCLVHYFPDRCGGLSPLTMIRDYRLNVQRRDLLPAYRAIVTNSAHVREVYARHLADGSRLHSIPLPVPPSAGEPARPWVPGAEGWRLLFTGRMALLKGGRLFLEALPEVTRRLDRPVHVTFAGDGPDRAEWERRADQARARAGGRLTIEFVGWVEGDALDALRDRSDLLVVPSLWPEPFGLVGPEAGLRGVPAVAFASGGIGDWLIEGVNGYLAPANPPTASGLAEAIVRALGSEARYEALREGAIRVATRFSRTAHVEALSRVFAAAVERNPQPVGVTRP